MLLFRFIFSYLQTEAKDVTLLSEIYKNKSKKAEIEKYFYLPD